MDKSWFFVACMFWMSTYHTNRHVGVTWMDQTFDWKLTKTLVFVYLMVSHGTWHYSVGSDENCNFPNITVLWTHTDWELWTVQCQWYSVETSVWDCLSTDWELKIVTNHRTGHGPYLILLTLTHGCTVGCWMPAKCLQPPGRPHVTRGSCPLTAP